jgi:2-polyprenyl-3-methyl-5-hydroxy-6-metoxy-1,4-benzoquinol methylase
MDRPDLDPRLHLAALHALARINALSATAGSLWPAVRGLAPPPARVADLACGGGDVLVRLARKARAAGLPIEFAGYDVSPTALDAARRRAEGAGVTVTFERRDLFAEGPPAGYDGLMCSLFLHHLDDRQAVALLKGMAEAAGRLVLVNDLRRSARGLWLARAAARVLTRSPVVRADGPQSVEAAFTLPEARELAARAGLDGAEVRPVWPFRYLLTWRRPTGRERTSA